MLVEGHQGWALIVFSKNTTQIFEHPHFDLTLITLLLVKPSQKVLMAFGTLAALIRSHFTYKVLTVHIDGNAPCTTSHNLSRGCSYWTVIWHREVGRAIIP